ncbi:nuclear transport factor 2 family protein [Rhodococcus sp. USK10]|nr:nuclear transport factor 2 family protein [Rhodococcus sp. USK10]
MHRKEIKFRMAETELEVLVRELKDRQDIHDCVMNYARGVDRQDRELLLSVYHPDAIDDHGMFVGNREEFADWCLGMHIETHVSGQHCILNHVCDLDGNTAHSETYYMFAGMNREGAPLGVSGGRYIDRFEKRSGRWAIAHRVCVRDWATGIDRPDLNDPSTLTAIRHALDPGKLELLTRAPASRRDRFDLSYDRPLRSDPERLRMGRMS